MGPSENPEACVVFQCSSDGPPHSSTCNAPPPARRLYIRRLLLALSPVPHVLYHFRRPLLDLYHTGSWPPCLVRITRRSFHPPNFARSGGPNCPVVL